MLFLLISNITFIMVTVGVVTPGVGVVPVHWSVILLFHNGNSGRDNTRCGYRSCLFVDHQYLVTVVFLNM